MAQEKALVLEKLELQKKAISEQDKKEKEAIVKQAEKDRREKEKIMRKQKEMEDSHKATILYLFRDMKFSTNKISEITNKPIEYIENVVK